jgi:hypothetical protein
MQRCEALPGLDPSRTQPPNQLRRRRRAGRHDQQLRQARGALPVRDKSQPRHVAQPRRVGRRMSTPTVEVPAERAEQGQGHRGIDVREASIERRPALGGNAADAAQHHEQRERPSAPSSPDENPEGAAQRLAGGACDALPSRSAKFNSGRDNSESAV